MHNMDDFVVFTEVETDRSVTTCVTADGEKIRIPRILAKKMHLHPNVPYPRSQFDTMLEKQAVPAALAKAASLLSLRSRTVKEMEEALQKSAYDEQTIAFVIRHLLDAGYLNDEAFALHWIRHRQSSGLGSSRILRELLFKGIDKELAVRCLQQVREEDDTSQEAALDRALDKILRGRNPDDPKERQRILAAMARRGFSIGDTLEALRRRKEDSSTF